MKKFYLIFVSSKKNVNFNIIIWFKIKLICFHIIDYVWKIWPAIRPKLYWLLLLSLPCFTLKFLFFTYCDWKNVAKLNHKSVTINHHHKMSLHSIPFFWVILFYILSQQLRILPKESTSIKGWYCTILPSITLV